ncbi:MAG: flagellar motor switch protein FliM [Quisquiliibacterium sp.]
MAENKPLLSAEEIEALASGLEDGSIDTTSGYNVSMPVRKHDLAAEDSSLGVNVASLDMINERFIRLFRLGMLEVLRTSPRMNPTRAQIVRFGDYLKGLRAPTSVNIVRMAPLRGYSMVVIEPTVVFSSLDSFFGGFGRGVGQLPPGRLFTPTETRIVKIILQVLFRSFKEAWSPVTAVDFEHVSSEINPQFAQIADENDLVVLSRFESEVTTQGAGFVDMVIPYVSLKPVRDLLRSRVQTGDGNEESDKQWRSQLTQAVHDAELDMRVVLGKFDVSLQQLQNMQAGDVMYFKKPDYARVHIEEMPIYEVEVGAMGGQVAIKIVEAISPQESEQA